MVKEKVPSKPINVPKLIHLDWHSIHPNGYSPACLCGFDRKNQTDKIVSHALLFNMLYK